MTATVPHPLAHSEEHQNRANAVDTTSEVLAAENRQLCKLEPEDHMNCTINVTPPQTGLAAHASAAAHGTEASVLQVSNTGTEIDLSEWRSEKNATGYCFESLK